MRNSENISEKPASKKLIFVTLDNFPYGTPGALRYINMCVPFMEKGYKPFFIGFGDTNYRKTFEFEYGEYVSVRQYRDSRLLHKVISHLFAEKRAVDYAKEIMRNGDVVIASQFIGIRQIRRLAYACEKRNVRFLTSFVEFLDASEFRARGIFNADFNKCKSLYKRISKNDGPAICISRYIERFLTSKSLDTFTLPFVFSRSFITPAPIPRDDGRIIILYVGAPGRKDLLYTMLAGIASLGEETDSKIQVKVAGVGLGWLNEQTDDPLIKERIKSFVTFYGKIAYSKIRDLYNSADFSMLLRDENAVYAKAGFPTKISESLFYGVPPITNYTSDLDLFLSDCENSIQVYGHDEAAFAKAIKSVVALSGTEITKMHKKARETALSKLSIESYSEQLISFIAKN